MASRKIEVQITGSSSSLERSLSRSGSAATRFGATVGKSVVGGVAAAGAALVGFGGFAVKAAVDFESSFAGVRKTVDGTEKEFARLSKGLLDMSRRLPVNVNELNKIAEAAGQLGIRKKSILEFTETIAKLGVSSNLAGEEGAAMLARFANITKLPQDQFDNLGATIVALGNAGASTEAEIAEMALRIGAAGSQVGFTQPQILGLANALASVGVQAEAGGTAISTAMIRIEQAVRGGGKGLEAFARVAGMSAEEFASKWRANPSAALADFTEGLGKVGAKGGDVFKTLEQLGLGGIRVRDSLLRLAGAGDLLRKSLSLGEQSWKANIALNREAEQRFKTTASQLQLLKNNISAVAIVAGSELLPAFNRALLAVTGFASDFFAAKGIRAKLNVVWEGVQEAGQTIAAKLGDAIAMVDWRKVWGRATGIASALSESLSAKLADVDWKAVGDAIGNGIVAGVGTAGEIGKKLADAVTVAVRAVNWEQIGLAMGPALAAAVLAAFGTLLDPGFWARNWELAFAVAATAFSGPVGRLGSKLLAPLGKLGGDIVVAIIAGIEQRAPRIATVLLAAVTKLPGVVGAALRPLGALVEKTFDKIGSAASFVVKVVGIAAALNTIGSFAASVAGKLKGVYNSWVSAARGWTEAAKSGIASAVQAVLAKIRELPPAVSARLGEMVSAIVGAGVAAAAAAADIGRKIVAGVLSGITGLPSALGSKLKGYIDSAVSWAGGLLRGSGEFMFTKQRVGLPLAQGVVDGFTRGIVSLGPAMQRGLSGAVATAAASVDTLAAKFARQEQMLARFAAALTPMEAQLAAMDAAEERRSQQAAVRAAKDELVKARAIKNAGERNTAIAAANEALRQAELAITTSRLEGVAERERAGRDKQVQVAAAALERMRTQVAAKADAMGAAFDRMGEQLQRAFGAKTQQMLDQLAAKFDGQIASIRRWQAELTGAERAAQGMTAAEAELAALDASEGERSRQIAVQQAQEALAKAQAIEDAQERTTAILAAEEQLRSAQLAITRQRLTERAAVERAAAIAAAAEERAERDRQAAERIAALETQRAAEIANMEETRRQEGEQLAAQLEQLKAQLAKRPGEYAKINAKIVTLLRSFGVDMTNSGELLGEAFAKGLDRAQNEVARSAKALAAIVARYLRLGSPAEAGPMKSIETWWRGMAPALTKGIGYADVARASSRLAAVMAPGLAGGPDLRFAGVPGGRSLAQAAAGGGGGGGGAAVTFTGPVYTDERGLEELTRRIVAQIDRQRRRN